MTNVLVTGAAGAIGVALCERLDSSGYSVVGVDKRVPRWDISGQFEQADLASSPSLPDADAIVHLAAHSRVPPIVQDPSKAFTNVAVTEPVLEHARRTDARVIFASSREVYGNAVKPEESDVGLDAVNPYAGSKLACESLCNSYHNCYELDVTTLRLANVYGRYDTNTRVVPIFVALATVGRELPVYGAEKILDFVHIEDVVNAFAAVIEADFSVSGETINIGSGSGTELVKLARQINSMIDSCPGYRVDSYRKGEVNQYVANISTARELLEWVPEIPLEDGLSRTIEWYTEHEKVLEEIRSSVDS